MFENSYSSLGSLLHYSRSAVEQSIVSPTIELLSKQFRLRETLKRPSRLEELVLTCAEVQGSANTLHSVAMFTPKSG